MVKRLRRRPLTAKTGVRVPVGLPLSDPTFSSWVFCRDGGAVERARLEIVFTPIRVTRVQIPFSAPKHPEFGVFFCYCGGSILNFRYSERRELTTDVTYRNTPDFGMRTYALFSFFAFSMSAPLISMIWSMISPAFSTPWSNAFSSCLFINPPTLFTGALPPDFLCAPTFLRLALLWA